MGLDITAYTRLHRIEASDIEFDEDGYPLDYDDFIYFGSLATLHEEYWPGRAAPFDQDTGAYYDCEDSDGMRAGSYSGYNSWRGLLSGFADWLLFEHDIYDAFEEQIEFSDCEGLIGTVVSEKLYNDYVGNRHFLDEYASQYIEDDETRQWFIELYDDWTHMFDMGRDDGAVQFH